MPPATLRNSLAATALVAFVGLYWNVFGTLISDWSTDDNDSHGFCIIPLALFFLWERRDRLREIVPRPSIFGVPLLLFGGFVLLAGLYGADRFLPRVSMIFVLAGSIVFVWGWSMLKAVAFPLGFLVLMIPLPALIFNQIAFPLQLLASQAGEATLSAAGIPVLREGNVIVLAHTTLEVAEACSGIRSLVSLMSLGIVFGYFTDPRGGVRVAIVLSTIPIAIVANAARVAGTGIAAHYYGVAAAEGFFHTFSGWLVFGVSFILMFVVARMLVRVTPVARPTEVLA